MSQMLPTTRHSISLAQRTNIAVLVGLSRLLRHLKPHRLQRLMSLVVRARSRRLQHRPRRQG